MSGVDWLRRAGSLTEAGRPMVLEPQQAGWAYSGMQILDLAAVPEQQLNLAGTEAVLLSLSSPRVSIAVDGTVVELAGRRGVFAGVSDWAYLPVGAQVTVSGEPGEVALCTAVAEQVLPMQIVRADQVPVEVRGAGQATRQVNNIATPTSFTGAQRINVCEVLTPGGNWSSWPPHRHDGLADCPYTNEEIYYFRMGNQSSDHGTN
ncbi:MAG: 5-deoxy-glucuronate isomerase, partial [Actinomycetales bacterium]